RLSSVVSDFYDMCIDGCVGFTGPLAICKTCPTCGKHRYDQLILQKTGKKKPCQQFFIFRLGPQLQA
ncbi:hypothetical protein K488DRAFT_6446, partial [Vararia minispora EC-137]